MICYKHINNMKCISVNDIIICGSCMKHVIIQVQYKSLLTTIKELNKQKLFTSVNKILQQVFISDKLLCITSFARKNKSLVLCGY